jgi:hypothetical protein
MTDSRIVARKGKITLAFAGDEYTFCLRVDELMELQEYCDAGPRLIEARLESGVAFRYQDVEGPIRLGLKGGGYDPNDIRKLIKRYVEPPDNPLVPNALIAQAIMHAVNFGVPDEALKKAEGETATSPSHLSPTEKSASQTISDAVAQWGSTSVQ